MPLYGIRIDCDYLVQRVERDITAHDKKRDYELCCTRKPVKWQKIVCRTDNIPDVVVAVAQELAQYVNGHNAQTTVGFDVKYCHNCLVQDGIADILGGVRVCSDLSCVE